MMRSTFQTPLVALFTTALAATASCGISNSQDQANEGDIGEPAPTDDDAASRLGSQVSANGTTFSVWAPNADRVFVTGSFNQWNDNANELTKGLGGVFTGEVRAAKAGDEYRYVIHRGATVVKRADPRAGRMTNSIGNSVVTDPAAYVWKTTNYQTPAINNAIVYEMHLGTFADEPGGRPGTWQTATAKLNYLKELGINMIELMPPSEFAGDFSWGYNASYPFAPESAYGTPDDMKRFIDEAHARGIGVLIDVVHNHYGPTDLPMWCFDSQCYGAGGSYFYTDDRLESGWGPRPDFGRPEVRDFVVDSARMWLEEYRADGLRWDSTVNIRTAAGRNNADGWRTLQRANEWVRKFQPQKLMIAEDLQGNEWLVKDVGAGGAGFASQWDAGFFHPVDDALIQQNDAGRNMGAIKGAIENRYAGRASARVIYTESHDEVANGKQRIPEMIWPGNAGGAPSKQRSTLGAAVVFTAPGIPMLFQGQEFLESGYFRDDVPLDWSKTTKFAGIVALYRDLIALRKNAAGTTRGLQGNNVNVFHVNNQNKLIAFHRWAQGGAGDDVIVILNFSNRAFTQYDIGLPRAGTWKVRFNSASKRYDAAFDGTAANDITAQAGNRDGLGFHGTVGVGAYSAVILSQ